MSQAGPLKQSTNVIANSYEWSDELFGCDFLAAPVSLFKHAPLHDMWDNTFEGMKVEVKNTDGEGFSDKTTDYFWVATVLKVSYSAIYIFFANHMVNELTMLYLYFY